MKADIIGQNVLVDQVEKVFKIFKSSDCEIKPHFIITGPSGASKTYTVKNLAEEHQLGFLEINAAQLTKEGTAGNSLSKALSPLIQRNGTPTIVLVDEFDKLFISGNNNDSAAHETTVGVQNEFLKILEGQTASVYNDYGKYANISISNILFVFVGAFNGEEDINLDRLREIGLKTEFLGRVGIVFNSCKLSLQELFDIVDNNSLIDQYCNLVVGSNKEEIKSLIKGYLQINYENNSIGARIINTLVHQYFINGGLPEKIVKKSIFQKKIKL